MTKIKRYVVYIGIGLALLGWMVDVWRTGFNTAAEMVEPVFYQEYEVPQVNVPEKAAFNIEDHLDRIRFLESSGGKNDSCKKQGKINGYGYAQSTNVWKCYNSHQEVRKYVRNWFKVKIPEIGLAQSICYYNTGYKINHCQYYENYKTL